MRLHELMTGIPTGTMDLREAFHDSFDNPENDLVIEIYRNPSAGELRKLVREWQRAFEEMVQGTYTADVRILLTKQDLFCWGAAYGIHPHVQTHLKLSERSSLRIEWTPGTTSVSVSSIEAFDEDKATAFILNHPAFRAALPQVTSVDVRQY